MIRQLSSLRIAVLVAAIFLLPGCAPASYGNVQQSADQNYAVPSLTEEQHVRDNVARSEQAIAESAGTLASLATECEECGAALTNVQRFSTSRLEGAGGLWEPLVDSDALMAAAQPDPIGNAPLRPIELSGYMHATASQQLRQVAELPDDFPLGQRTVLASLLVGRIVSAEQLAAQYDTSPVEAATGLPLEATLPAANSALVPLPLSAPPQPEASGDTSAESALDTDTKVEDTNDADPVVATVIEGYDCAATSLRKTTFAETNPASERQLFDELQERRIVLGQVGGRLPISVRCELQVDDADDLFETIVGLDLQLLGSGSTNARLWAAHWLVEDGTQLSTWGNLLATTPGMVPADAKESDG